MNIRAMFAATLAAAQNKGMFRWQQQMEGNPSSYARKCDKGQKRAVRPKASGAAALKRAAVKRKNIKKGGKK